jgi:hypothetical protein
MKKILVALLVLACMGFVAFAQDAKPVATFGQYMDLTASYNGVTPNMTYGVYNETYFNFSAAEFGFSATVVSGADLFAQPRNYAISYKTKDMMGLTIKAGMLRETGGARFTSYIDGNGFSTRMANVSSGVLATIKPVAGLVVSVFQPYTGSSKDLGGENFVAQYSLPDLADIAVGYRMQGTAEFNVGASIKAVKDLTAIAGFRMTLPTSGTGKQYIYLTAGSSALVPGVDVGLDADIVLASTLGYGAKVYAQYSMSPFDFGIKVSYDNASDAWYNNGSSAGTSSAVLNGDGTITVTPASAAVAAVGGVVVNPYVRWNFGASDIKVGVNYDARVTGAGALSIPIDFELSY